MRAWWQRQTTPQQWGYLTAAALLGLALLATAAWAAIIERRWLAAEWASIRPNLEANLAWAPLAWLYARWHVRRLHRKLDRLHAKVDQQHRDLQP